MKQIYYFKIASVRNDAGQMRKTVFPLPNQRQISNVSDYGEPLEESWKVQLSSRENTKACALPNGTVIAVVYEGDNENELWLSARYKTREINGESVRVMFYRTDNEILFVQAPGYDMHEPMPDEIQRTGISRASSQVISGYEFLYYGINSNNSNNSSTLNEVNADNGDTDAYAASSVSELRAIEERFAVNGTPEDERRNLKKILKIAQVLDRMKLGVATFSYFKQNGNHRLAYGTRNPDIIRSFTTIVDDPRGNNGSAHDGDHVSYFDIQRRDWRCFCASDIDDVELRVIPISEPALIASMSAAPIQDQF